jgi:hypothetical protein
MSSPRRATRFELLFLLHRIAWQELGSVTFSCSCALHLAEKFPEAARQQRVPQARCVQFCGSLTCSISSNGKYVGSLLHLLTNCLTFPVGGTLNFLVMELRLLTTN